MVCQKKLRLFVQLLPILTLAKEIINGKLWRNVSYGLSEAEAATGDVL